MSKDARQKLRDMGGIMASSPDLIQAVQKFNNGGPIMPMPPRAPSGPNFAPRMPPAPMSGIRPTMPSFIASDRPYPAAKTPRATRLGGRTFLLTDDNRVIDAETNSPAPAALANEVRRKLKVVDPVPEYREAGPLTYGGGAAPSPEMPVGSDDVTIADLLDASLARGVPRENNTLGRTLAEAPDAGSAPSMPGSLRRPVLTEDYYFRNEPGPRRPQTSSISGALPSVERAVSPVVGSKPSSDIEDDTAPAPGETLPPMITNDPEGTASEALSSLDKSYEEKLALFQKVFGDGDEDKSRDRAMSLAMIGLAIAAGQSPNALTNIAQGAMVGLNAMGEQRKERQAKKERVKVMALDAALKEHAAQQEFARELGLEAIKAGNKSQYRDTPTVRQEGAFGDVEVFLPTPQAAQQGAQPIIADVAGLDRKYKQSLDGRQKVFGMVDQAEQLIEQYDIAGFEGAMARFKQDFSAATPKFLKEAFGFDGTSGTPTPQQQYDTLMRAMAAQFTPIILGESGRTISDGDRQRVAQILGFAVDQTTGKIGQYEGTAFTSEAELKSALSEVRSILGSSYSEMDRIYSRYRPEQYSKMQENNQKQAPSNRLRFDINGNPVE